MSSLEIPLRSGPDVKICGNELGATLQPTPSPHWQDRNNTVQSGFLWSLPQTGLLAVDLFFGLGSVRKNLASNSVTCVALSALSKMEEHARKGVYEAKQEQTS